MTLAPEGMPDLSGETVDVCVVGSGAGGAPLALRLAQAGARVVVLEKGPWYTKKDFLQDEILTVRRDWWVPYVDDEPHTLVTDASPTPTKSNFGWVAQCVGGGTCHMSGFFYRHHPADFRMKERYGDLDGANLADWPISYEELAPFYDEVEREVGVSGEAVDHPHAPPRSGPYPYPPLWASPLAELVDEGARKVGVRPFQTPRAILSRAKGKRSSCSYCDLCGSYGCLVDAKGSTMAALIPGAVATGKCEVRPGAFAVEVTTDPEGRARGVRWLDGEGRSHEQRARVVVVSATAVESARLLLNSTSPKHPRGLGNGSGLVGRNLTFSTVAKGYGVFEQAALPERLRGRHDVHFLQRSVQDWYFLADRDGYDKAGTLHYLLPHRNPILQAERLAARSSPRLWGAALKAEVRRFWNDVHEIEFETFGEFLPNDGTHVTVDDGVKDRFGVPVARITIRQHPGDVANARALLDRGLEVLDAAGAKTTAAEEVAGVTSVLQQGTCRFGDDPATSVLDRDCRSHEVDNLYVVDGSFLPTSGGVPSTFTIMANSFRVGKALAERFRRGELPRG